MTYVREILYKTSTLTGIKPWPLWGRLLFWTVMLGLIIDGLL